MARVFINAGHGGNDSGAVGFGLKEKDVAYCIAARVESYLHKFNLPTKLFQIDGLEKICATSNNWDADFFVSIHCNAFNGTANGTESYCFYGSSEGRKFATSIHNQIVKTFPELTNRGVKEAGYYVLGHTNAPAVLVETAFIDNLHDNELLKNRADDFARAIAQGILLFVGITPDLVICPYCGHQL